MIHRMYIQILAGILEIYEIIIATFERCLKVDTNNGVLIILLEHYFLQDEQENFG